MFRIESSDGIVARNKNGEPEQVLILTTTADISTRIGQGFGRPIVAETTIEKKPEDDSETEATDESADANADSDVARRRRRVLRRNRLKANRP